MAATLTPMMRQYRRIKGELPQGVILFFRLGDFYEMFFEDAKQAAPILEIALTKRQSVPMCGVPYHSVENYVAKLVKAGRKVAICDQVEDPGASGKIVRREVVRVVTPGTVLGDGVLDAGCHNFLAAVNRNGDVFGIAFLDLSTGLFWGEETSAADELHDSLRKYSPNECLVPAEQADDPVLCRSLDSVLRGGITPGEDWTFEYEAARENLVRHLGVHSLEGFGCEGKKAAVGAAGAVLHYVKDELLRRAEHVRSFRFCRSSDFLMLDDSTCANLDLVPLPGRSASVSLLSVLDVTRTAMGGRLLRDWVLRPLAEMAGITMRHEAVETFCTDRSLLGKMREELGDVRDMERLMARISSGSGNARDIMALGHSLTALPGIKALFEGSPVRLLRALDEAIDIQPDLVDLIQRAIVEEPPATARDGGVIRNGYNPELDSLRQAATEGRSWLAEYQAREIERTGIKTLKVRHNKVFGYYIEVSKGQLGNVPAEYTRKQTLVNAERFITPELKEYEGKILGAQERAIALEHEIFVEVRDAVALKTEDIQAAAGALAQMDVLASLADRALALGYVRPTMTERDRIVIKDGRHPVIEQMPDAERFVPNDALLDCAGSQLIIITGPNMAGKSTYIRQVALTVIMAHMGSFVPAREAEMSLVDRVFTRVGASDDLAGGRSTFMVEMQETANILNNATPRSLIVLDEIGRGTSTFDGISIAWAVAEYLHTNERVKAKTLFATHYHELTDLAMTMGGIKNYNVLVREKNDRVVFLRRIVPGAADKSYGIQVARLAGLPVAVLDRAREILANLEEGELAETGQPKIASRRSRKDKGDPSQMDLFGGSQDLRPAEPVAGQ